MAAGPVNQALLESNFQSPGQIYDDAKTEGAFNVVAQQVNENWFSQAALIAAVNGLVVGTQVIEQKMNFFRQALINGSFDIWQRGINTGFAFSVASAGEYTADRWKAYRTGLVSGMEVFRRVDATLPTVNYVAEFGRTSGNSATNAINFGQALPTEDSIKLRGQQLTLSFSGKYQAGFTAAAQTLTVTVSYGTGTDQDVTPPITGQTTIGTAGFTLSTSYQTFQLTTTAVPLTATQIFVVFSYTPIGVAPANDACRIALVQLCAGNVALPFQPKSSAQELLDCQRYTIGAAYTTQTIGQGTAHSTTAARVLVPFPTTMRTAPTSVSIGGSVWRLDDGVNAAIATTTITMSAADTSPNMAVLLPVVAGGLTQFRNYRMYPDGIARQLVFDAEF